MMVYSDIRDAFEKSTDSGMFEPANEGWMAKLEHEYETAYKATLWNDGHGLAIWHWFTARSAKQAAEFAARYMKQYHDNELWPKTPAEKVKDWYTRTCPTDECGYYIDADVTFARYLLDFARYKSAYIYGIDDSIVRQRVMAATAHVMGLDYDEVYDLWRV